MAAPISKKRSKKLIVLYAVAFLVFLGALAAIGGYVWYNKTVNDPASNITTPLELKVNAGETLSDIAPKIQKAGGIQNLEVFKIYTRLNNVSVPLQVGTYEIPLNVNIPGLIAELQNGPKLLSVSVTIREGLRMDEIADVIAVAFKDVKHSAFDEAEFTSIITNPDAQTFPTDIANFLKLYKPQGDPLEGFLFPDTYNIGVDAGAIDVVDLLLSNFISRLNENNINPATAGNSVGGFYNLITYASVVEKEAFDLPEKKMVADIFIRRVTQGFGLGSDATILYPYKRWSPPPTAAELQSDTAYNSRIHYGLIPTPICSPGMDAIKAVTDPTTNDYYYFLHGPDGTIHYARTLAEHNQNIANYL